MPAKPGPSSGGKWYADEIDKNGVFTRVWVQDKGIDNYTFLGPYATEDDAKRAAEGIVGTKTLTGWRGLVAELQVGTSIEGPKIGNPLTGLAAIGDFFSRLGQASTWERAGMVTLGLILIAVGVARITQAVPIATHIAEAVK